MADTNITARFFPNPVPQFFATDGTPAAGYKLFHFTTGTTEDKDIWTEEVDSSDTDSKHAQPIVLNSRGEVPGGMFGYGKYTFMLIPPTGPEDDYSDAIWTINDVDVLTIQDYIRDTLFACANAAAVRTALGLGDAALLDDELNQAGNAIKWDDSGMYPVGDGTNITKIAHVSDAGVWDPTPPLPRSYLAGYGLSNGTDADHDIDIAAGACRDSTDAYNIPLSSGLTKQIDAEWSSGSSAGGRQTGSTLSNNTWYYVYAIYNATTDASDVLISPNAVTPSNLPSGYAYFRRIGAVRTDGSANIIAFTQYGDEFIWDTIQDDHSGTIDDTDNTITLGYVPTGFSVEAISNVLVDKSGAFTSIIYPSNVTSETPTGLAATAPGSHTGPGTTFGPCEGEGDEPQGGMLRIRTDSAAAIHARANTTSVNIYFFMLGWIDRRGRDD